MHIGKSIKLKGSGRITPAGVVTVSLMTVAIFLAATALGARGAAVMTLIKRTGRIAERSNVKSRSRLEEPG